jgi:hypothetical protein
MNYPPPRTNRAARSDAGRETFFKKVPIARGAGFERGSYLTLSQGPTRAPSLPKCGCVRM